MYWAYWTEVILIIGYKKIIFSGALEVGFFDDAHCDCDKRKQSQP